MATLLLTGATGYAGGYVLSRMVEHSGVSRIVSLQRKPLPVGHPHKSSSKLREIIVPSEAAWTEYPAEVLSQLEEVSGVVWVLGAIKFPDSDTARRVSIDYVMHGLHSLLATSRARPIRFVYTSGSASIRDADNAGLLGSLGGEVRRIRGATENQLLAAGADKSKSGPATALDLLAVVRPGFITDTGKNVTGYLRGMVLGAVFPSVDAKDLATGMVELALKGKAAAIDAKVGSDGNDITRIVENDEIERLGRARLNPRVQD